MDNSIILHSILFFITSLVTGLGMQIMVSGHIPTSLEYLDSIIPSMILSGYIMTVDGHTIIGDVGTNTRSFGAGMVIGGFTKLLAMFARSVHKKDPIAVISVVTECFSEKISGALNKMKDIPDNESKVTDVTTKDETGSEK